MESEGAAADAGTAGPWAQAVDTALVDRLHDRARRPGLVRLGQAHALLARHRGMVAGVPLADALIRRVPERAVGRSDMPVVTGRPVPVGGTAPVAGEPLPVARTAGPEPGPVVTPAVAPSAVVPVRSSPGPATAAPPTAPTAPTAPTPTRSTDAPGERASTRPARPLAAHPSAATSSDGDPFTVHPPAVGPPAVGPPAAISPPASAVPTVRPVPSVAPAPAPDPAPAGHDSPPTPARTRTAAGPGLPDAGGGSAPAPARPLAAPPVTPSPPLPAPSESRPMADRATGVTPAAVRTAPRPVPAGPAAPADLPLARVAVPVADTPAAPPVVTARRPRLHDVSAGRLDPGIPLVRPTSPALPEDAPVPVTAEGRPTADRLVVRPGDSGPDLAEQVHRLVVRELTGNLPAIATAPAPPLPLPVQVAPPSPAGGPQAVRRPPAPVVRADRPAERPQRAAPPVDVGRVADAVSRRLARRGAVEAERRGMGR